MTQSSPVTPLTVPFDPELVPLCGGNVTATLILCYFEKLFIEAACQNGGVVPDSLARDSLEDWYYPLGWNRPQPFFKSFYSIGVLHIGKHKYAEQALAHREFISERTEDYVYYAIEVISWHKTSVLHRNSSLITNRLNNLRGIKPELPSMEQGPYVNANRDAAALIHKLKNLSATDS